MSHYICPHCGSYDTHPDSAAQSGLRCYRCGRDTARSPSVCEGIDGNGTTRAWVRGLLPGAEVWVVDAVTDALEANHSKIRELQIQLGCAQKRAANLRVALAAVASFTHADECENRGVVPIYECGCYEASQWAIAEAALRADGKE